MKKTSIKKIWVIISLVTTIYPVSRQKTLALPDRLMSEIVALYAQRAPFYAAAVLNDIYALTHPKADWLERKKLVIATGMLYTGVGDGVNPLKRILNGWTKRDIENFLIINKKRMNAWESFGKKYNLATSPENEQKLREKYRSLYRAHLAHEPYRDPMRRWWYFRIVNKGKQNREVEQACLAFEREGFERRQKLFKILQDHLKN